MATEEITALAKIVVPEVIDLEVFRRDIGPSIDKALEMARRIQVNITDDKSLDLATDSAERMAEISDILKNGKEKHHLPLYVIEQDAYNVFAPRMKLAQTLKKDTLGAISDFKDKRERAARLAREKAEREAREIQEEADRKKKAAEEAEARAKQAIEDEKRRKKEAEEAEERRVKAEREAKEKAERDAREAAVRETLRKQKEEEDARLAHAQEAQDQGNIHKVDSILEQTMPISPVLASPQMAPDLETLRIEKELANKRAAEKAEADKIAAEEAAKKQKEAADEATRLRAEADKAEADAKAAQAMAAVTSMVTRPDSRTTTVIRWKWDLDSDGTVVGDCAAFLKLARAVADGHAPIEYLGFDPDHPEKFRPEAINKDVTESKDRFSCPGLKAYPQADEQLKRRTVGGRR